MSKVGFIGGGALAESIVRGICGKTFAPRDIFISEIRAARCEELSKRKFFERSRFADCRGQAEGRGRNFRRVAK